MDKSLRLIGTCPVAKDVRDGKEYLDKVSTVARWGDDDGWESLLIYTDHRQVDPWLVAQIVIQTTKQIRPLIAVQPLYMHPFALAKNVMTLGFMHDRQVHLNLVAGGFPRDLEALCDDLPHDRRYDRLIDYASLVMNLLRSRGMVTHRGEHYPVANLQLMSPLPERLVPALMVSGSSAAGLAAARRLHARAIQYLRPAEDYELSAFPPDLQHGTRLGVITRDTSEAAWSVATARFPEDLAGASIRRYAASISDSVWVKELSKDVRVAPGHPYWLGPYRHAQSSCPFLVGSHHQVAIELASYMRLGFTTFLLEQPEDREDSKRITEVFELAKERARSAA